jgi:hypothetical protein
MAEGRAMSDQKPGRAPVSRHTTRYDDIEDGVAPSPFTSIVVVGSFASAFAAAVIGESMGETGAHLWILAAITGGVAVILITFASTER